MSRARDIADLITAAIEANTIQSDGTITGTTTKVNTHDSDGALLAADSSGYADGSLHYMTTPRRLMLWDDSDGGFFEITVNSSELEAIILPGNHQGSSYGYVTNGETHWASGSDKRDRISFTSDGNSVGRGSDLSNISQRGAACSSPSHGYVLANSEPSSNPNPTPAKQVARFAFASDNDTQADVGDLTYNIRKGTGHQSQSHGFRASGTINGLAYNPTSNPGGPYGIDKWAFASDTNQNFVNKIQSGHQNYGAGQASTDTHGYMIGGVEPAPYGWDRRTIKFPFAVDAVSSEIGDIQYGAQNPGSANSETDGYVFGGYGDNTAPGGNTFMNNIQKFSFSSSYSSSDIGDLTTPKDNNAGNSSTTHGYSATGNDPAPGISNIIEKFSFASNGNASDVGDTSEVRGGPSGNQQI